MVKLMRDSSLYVSILGYYGEISDVDKDKIDLVIKEVIGEKVSKVSDIDVDNFSEIVYEIPTPIINEESVIKAFFEDLEVMFEELKEFNPHFTQYKKGDV